MLAYGTAELRFNVPVPPLGWDTSFDAPAIAEWVNGRGFELRTDASRIGIVSVAIVGDAVAALHRICADVRFLGSYERRDGVQTEVPIGREDRDFVDARAWLARVRATGTS